MLIQKNTFKKQERLSSKLLIDSLFVEAGQLKVKEYPLLLIAKEVNDSYFETPSQCMFVVPKKKVKKATTRNLVRRRLKESFRLNKKELNNTLEAKNKKIIFAIIYLENKPLKYQPIEKKIIVLLNRLKTKIESGS